MLVHRIIVLGSLPLVASAAFTQQACWQRNCLARNDAGTLCFVPSAYQKPLHTCKDDVLVHLLDMHVNSTFGASIAYYNERASLVGTSSWSILNTSPSPLFVCMSGRDAQADGAYRTLCRLALRDDDVVDAKAHTRECWIYVGQQVVTDGCYTVTPVRVPNLSNPPRKLAVSVAGASSTAHILVLCALAGALGVCAIAFRYRTTRANFLSPAGRMVGRWIKRAFLTTTNLISRARPPTRTFLFLQSTTVPGFDAYAQASTAAEPVFGGNLGATGGSGYAVPEIDLDPSTV